MRGILIRLAENDGEAAAALKIITFFDVLSEQPGLDLTGLVTAASALAECPVCFQLSTGELFASTPRADGGEPEPSEQLERSSNGHAVWLEREGEPEPTDALILERCAMAVDRVAERLLRRHQPDALQDPHLLDALIDRGSSDAVRRVAAERLGLRPQVAVRLVAVDLADGSDRVTATLTLLARARGRVRPRNVAARDGWGIALLEEHASEALGDDLREALSARYGPNDSPIRCGVSSAVSLDRAAVAWAEAQAALKFSIHGSAEQAVTTYDGLGALSLLADTPVDRLRAHPDVMALEHLARSGSGRSDLKVLDVFCHNSSLRAAAQSLHLHHSSVAARILKIEQDLGWSIDTADGRFRTRLALLAHRLSS